MLKQIPKSDITLRPFKVFKNFTATKNNSIGYGYDATIAYNHTGSFDVLTTEEALQNGTWHQLHTMYYRDPHNLYTSYGTIKPTYTDTERIKQRVLNDTAYVFQVSQVKYGEEIKPKSLVLNSELLNETIVDDGHGNLISNYNSYVFVQLDIDNSLFIFEDPDGSLHTATLVPFFDEFGNTQPAIDLQNNIFQIQYQAIFYLIRVDVETSFISWLGTFDPNNAELVVSPIIMGNVFYSHGLVVITRDTDPGNVRDRMLEYDWQLNYQSTNTIYENEILLVVDEDEFNTSTNPSAVDFINLQNLEYTTSFEGIKRTHTFDAATIKPEFLAYEYSSSIDPTGSFIAPYVTTIGLYDENMDMVAVAKLATPIKSTPDLPVNFLVRIDT